MINPNNYYTVQGWMLSELGLKGNALAVYAIVYGFSQDGVSEYAGSSKYLCEWLNCSKKTVLTTLASLTEQGLLVKKTLNKNGVIFNNYVAVRRPLSQPQQGGEEITPPEKILHQGGEDFTPGAEKILHQGGEDFTPHIDIHTPIHTDMDINGAGAPPAAPKATTAEIDKFFDSVWKLYPVKKGKADVSEKKRRELYKIGYDEIKRAVDRYLQDLAKDAAWRKPKHGSTFFNAGYVDYLDANYEPDATLPQPAKPAGRGGHGAPAGNIGPNGIAIDPAKNDLDGIF